MFRAGFRYFLPLALAFIIAIAIGERVDSAKSKAETDRFRLVQQARRRNLRPEYDIRYRSPVESENGDKRNPKRRSSPPAVSGQSKASISNSASPPPPSPGLAIATTTWDFQHIGSSGHQVGRLPGADLVHFCWLATDRIDCDVDPCGQPYVAYNSYTISTGVLNQGFAGDMVSLGMIADSRYASIAVDAGNRAHIALQQRDDVDRPVKPWRLYFDTPGNSLHTNEDITGAGVPGCPELMWPQLAVSVGNQTAHEIAHTNIAACPIDLLWYWRFNGIVWTGPVIIDSTPLISYVLADDMWSQTLAIVVGVDSYAAMNDLNNVAYMESATDGAGWIAGTEAINKTVLTNYFDPDGPQAWLHMSTAYDYAGTLHIVWDEQRNANQSSETAIRHWNSSRQTIRTVALGYWPTPYSTGVYNLNLAKITLGIGNGGTFCQGLPNEDYLYVLYTRFGGTTPQEQADVSALGYYNGELYLNVSSDGGASWSRPVNLTNTKTPRCNPGPADTISGIILHPDSVCRSEHWATLGQLVSDIDILFVSDNDAGSAIHGEGYIHLNPVHYLRLPGGTPNAQYLCPEIAPSFAAFSSSTVQCEYHAAPGEVKSDETLTIMNIGNATLSGSVSVIDAPWLTVVGGGGFALPAGSNDLVLPLTMNATSLGEGLYSGTIRITHNDSAQPSPYDIPVDLFVIADFNCTQGALISTGVE